MDHRKNGRALYTAHMAFGGERIPGSGTGFGREVAATYMGDTILSQK
jgi:hypothetical protein